MSNEETVANEIERILEEAWKKFSDYYKEKAPKYRESWPPKLKKEKDAKDSHWICWNEYDLIFYIGRFFYDILSKKKEGKFSNIEVHFEKNVNFTNFKDYDFFKPKKDKLEKFKEELKKIGRKRGPKVDMIVAYEDKSSPLLLCAEVKHFHYASERYNNETPIEKIDVDIKKLKVIRKLGIAKRAVFILFDDYYWCNDEETANAIQQRLEGIRRDGITVLDHTSEAKLENY